MSVRKTVALLAGVVAVASVWGIAATPAAGHRSGCHRWHSCPSDHATYRWHGLLCVAPYSDKRDSTFRKQVRYEGRAYDCKR